MKKIGRFLVSSSLLIASATVLCSFTDVQAKCQKQPIGSAQEAVAGNGFVCPGPGGVGAVGPPGNEPEGAAEPDYRADER